MHPPRSPCRAVIAVLTGGRRWRQRTRPLPAAAPVKGRGGAEQLPRTDRARAGRVRYVGEPVALVVAESTAGAQDAAETVTVEYVNCPGDRSALALARGAQLKENVPGNSAADFRAGLIFATELVRRAARVVELTSCIAASLAIRWNRVQAGGFDSIQGSFSFNACTRA